MRKYAALVFALLALLQCRAETPADPQRAHVTAARKLTELCAVSRLRTWNVKAEAAGDDCGILYVHTPIVMEDAMIEALHYGRGSYTVAQGGIQKFSKESAFRGVAYKDATDRIWAFDVRMDEAERLAPCR